MNDKDFDLDDALRRLGFEKLLGRLKSSTTEVLEKFKDGRPEENSGSKNVEELKKIIRGQETIIERLTSQPLEYATVAAVNPEKETVVIVFGGRLVEVALPKNKTVVSGDTVKLSQKTLQIVDVAECVYPGTVATVRQIIDKDRVEVDCQGIARVVLSGKCGEGLEAKDRVVLDSASSVIISKIGKDEERFRFSEKTSITWDDIGGLEEAKKEMIEAIELPHKYPDLFKFYSKRLIKGILLYGPTGCGKTMLAKAAAAALNNIYSHEGSPTGFIYIKGPEILSKYVGESEGTVSQIFDMARSHKKKTGTPAIIFLDEAEAILNKRGTGRSSDVERTIVPAFLAEMDGLEDSGAMVILATNMQDILDPAVVRDGRVDRKVKVTRPTKEIARDIFELYLKKIPMAPPFEGGASVEEMADFAAEELFSENRVLYEIVRVMKSGENETTEKIKFTLGSIASGAMIAGITDKASSIALHRDIKFRKMTSGLIKKTGLVKDNIKAAIDAAFQVNLDLNCSNDLEEFTYDFREDVIGIKKLRQTQA